MSRTTSCSRQKRSAASGMFRPFENLQQLLKNSSVQLSRDLCSPCISAVNGGEKDSDSQNAETSSPIKPDAECEKQLFQQAMADVIPLSGKQRIEKSPALSPPCSLFDNTEESEILLRLDNLVKEGEGFVIADTAEYIEGMGYQVNPEIVKRLHRGDFSIQGHIDLHGLGVTDAQEVFEAFFKDAVITGKRAVLVVHGRGLSSPTKPILKTRVQEWLTSGPLRKWVIAFTSARSCDGGTGATYVLLRKRPLTKRFRKKKKGFPKE